MRRTRQECIFLSRDCLYVSQSGRGNRVASNLLTREFFPMFLRTSSMRGKDQSQISRKSLTLGAGVEGGLRHGWLKVGRHHKIDAKSDLMGNNRRGVRLIGRLDWHKVKSYMRNSRREVKLLATWRKLGSYTSSAINQLLKVVSRGTDEARVCREWATRDKGLKRCKALKSEVSNWGLLASIYSLIYVSGEQ